MQDEIAIKWPQHMWLPTHKYGVPYPRCEPILSNSRPPVFMFSSLYPYEKEMEERDITDNGSYCLAHMRTPQVEPAGFSEALRTWHHDFCGHLKCIEKNFESLVKHYFGVLVVRNGVVPMSMSFPKLIPALIDLV